MKFFIMGDSWGVGEWERDWRFSNFTPTPVKDTGIDYYLTQAGHTVTNISVGMGGNHGQLRTAYCTLKENSNYDYIIWFHTTPLRDILQIIMDDPNEGAKKFPMFDINKWDQSLRYLNHQNYKFAQQKIYDEFHIPFIVIGGLGSVNKSIEEFAFAKFYITSWLGELLNIDPPIQSFGTWDIEEKILSFYQIDLKKFILEHSDYVNKFLEISKKISNSKDFPDEDHPSKECFKKLTYRLLDILDLDAKTT
jgi:hypothetical protein